MNASKQHSFFGKLQTIMADRAEESKSRMFFFGVFGLIAYLPYYLINLRLLNPAQYDSLWLRASIAFLCLLLVLKDFWPTKLRSFLPIYWYITLLYSMPFFLTFMALKNNGATGWVMNLLAIVVLMMLLIDWISYSILLISGALLAWLTFILTTPEGFNYLPGTVGYKDIANTLIASIVMGIIFSHNKEKFEKEKIDAMKLLAANLAHELRTPLAAIKAGTNIIKDYLPDLINSYELAKSTQLRLPNIYSGQLANLKNVLQHVETETELANNVIDMLLVNVKQLEIETADFKTCSISNCIKEALDRYPFSADDEKLINWKNDADFNFYGSKLLTIHVLFNLIKNSLYYIMASSKGNIEIWISDDNKYNLLHFYDSGSGIDANVLPHIFDRFYSKTYHGYGVGLAFCKMVMRSYGGDIICHSIKNEYTEFILKFPKLG